MPNISLWLPTIWFDPLCTILLSLSLDPLLLLLLLQEGNFEAMGIEGKMGVEKGKNWEKEEPELRKRPPAISSQQLVSRSLALRASSCNLLFNPDVKCHRAKIESYVIIAIVRRPPPATRCLDVISGLGKSPFTEVHSVNAGR